MGHEFQNEFPMRNLPVDLLIDVLDKVQHPSHKIIYKLCLARDDRTCSNETHMFQSEQLCRKTSQKICFETASWDSHKSLSSMLKLYRCHLIYLQGDYICREDSFTKEIPLISEKRIRLKKFHSKNLIKDLLGISIRSIKLISTEVRNNNIIYNISVPWILQWGLHWSSWIFEDFKASLPKIYFAVYNSSEIHCTSDRCYHLCWRE